MATRDISTLKHWDKNPRSIKKQDFERLKKQIQTLGQYKPLLITEDGTVLGGNMRLRAYKELGITDIWISVVDASTEAKKLEYALSDNDRAGYYDDDLLANLIPQYPEFEWKDYAVDMKAPQNLGDLVDRFAETEEDEAPELDDTKEPESKLGEVYQLGRHRLMCGDATKIEDVEKLMDGQKADMVFTDPPYGVDYQSNMRTKSEKFNVLKNDNTILTDWIPLLEVFSSGFIFIWTTWKVLDKWNEAVKPLGSLTNLIVWYKGGGGIGDLSHTFSTDYELAMVFGRGKEITGKRVGSVWEIRKDFAGNYTHPTQKPVGLAALAMKSATKTGQSVLDLFGGSGSTLISAEQTNRTCYMMELDPKYCDVIRKRYENYTQNHK